MLIVNVFDKIENVDVSYILNFLDETFFEFTDQKRFFKL